MNYLLDTHIVLWWLVNPKKISPKARHIIEDKENTIFISSVSFWEMAIKHSLGRLTIPANMLEVLSSQGFKMLPMVAEEGLSVSDLPFLHQDPFDRLLIMQAKLNHLIFITHDKTISQYPLQICLG